MNVSVTLIKIINFNLLVLISEINFKYH